MDLIRTEPEREREESGGGGGIEKNLTDSQSLSRFALGITDSESRRIETERGKKIESV